MNLQEVGPGIFIFNDVLKDPKNFIDNIENLVQNRNIRNWGSGTVLNKQKPHKEYEDVLEKKFRDVFVIGLPPFDRYPNTVKKGSEYAIHEFLDNNLLPYFEEYCKLNEAQDWKTKDGWQILKYGPEQFYCKHRDDCSKYNRTISMSYYPNDDYEGGEIEFPNFKLKIKPKANQAVFFPSNYVYAHIVNKVTSGYRYAVVNWWDV